MDYKQRNKYAEYISIYFEHSRMSFVGDLYIAPPYFILSVTHKRAIHGGIENADVVVKDTAPDSFFFRAAGEPHSIYVIPQDDIDIQDEQLARAIRETNFYKWV